MVKIIADTNVWIGYFRNFPQPRGFEDLLLSEDIIVHPWVYGELALGDLSGSLDKILRQIEASVTFTVSETPELLSFIGEYGLARTGLGLVDAELLRSCLIHGYKLWTVASHIE